MRTTTLVLIVSGVVLTAVSLWLATVMPIRNKVEVLNSDNSEATLTLHLNLWGTPVRKTFVQRRRLNDGSTNEVHMEGKALGMENHGPWTIRERFNDGEWVMHTSWFIDGLDATEQEWNAYLRGDKP